jgi:hypothetical protein
VRVARRSALRAPAHSRLRKERLTRPPTSCNETTGRRSTGQTGAASSPITSLALRSRAVDWLPARDFPSWPGPKPPTEGPEIRLQSTTPRPRHPCAPEEESR